jgi:hypothetical protein
VQPEFSGLSLTRYHTWPFGTPLAVKSRAMGESFKFRLRAPEASSSNVKLHLAFCERLEAKYFSYLSFRDFAQAL